MNVRKVQRHSGRAVVVNGVYVWECWCGARWLQTDHPFSSDDCPRGGDGRG